MGKTGVRDRGRSGRRSFFLVLLAAFLCAAALAAGDKGELGVLRLTPSGPGAPPGRQVVIQFDRPVVPVGRMERTAAEVPVAIEPGLACQWRWLNTSALCCQLNEADALTPATAYQVTVRPGLTAQDGATMAQEFRGSFATLRPRVEWAGVHQWTDPLTPVFRVTFNMPVTRKSVDAHLFLEPQGDSGKRVALKTVPELPDPEDRRYDEGLSVLPDQEEAGQKKEEKKIPDEAWSFYLLPASALAPDTAYALREEPGLRNTKGNLEGDASRQVADTCTFGPFAFLGVRTRDNAGNDFLFTPSDQCGQKPGADPQYLVQLVFSAPVTNSMVKDNAAFVPDLAGGRKDYDPWANRGDWSGLYGQHVRGQQYSVWLPELLKAARPYQFSFAPEKFKDQFGRGLENPGKYTFCTDHRRPRLVLGNDISVLERDVDTRVPAYVTNLKSFTVNYEKLTPGEGYSGQRLFTTPVPDVQDISFAVPLGIRNAIGEKGGIARGWIVTNPPQSDNTERFLCQVTPFAVHVKRGFYNTLVWVTRLSDGKPVADARVSVFYDPVIHRPEALKLLAQAVTDKDGLAMLPGNETLDPDQKLSDWMGGSYQNPVLQARVEKDEAAAVVPLSSEFSVQFAEWNYPRKIYGHIRTWGATAQGVYRAGDTIQYKIWVRNQANKTLAPSPKKTYTLKIVDPMGKTALEKTGIVLSDFGALDGEYPVPKNAAMGWYSFVLSADFTDYVWEPMQVLVTDFTPAPFKVRAEMNGELFRPGDRMEITARASMHAGGPFAGAPARITAVLSPAGFSPDTAPASEFFYATWAEDDDEEGSRQNLTLLSDTGTLDSQGVLAKTVDVPEKPVIYGTISVEADVSDDRGKFVAANARASYISRDRLVGLKSDKWMYNEGSPAGFSFLVVDDKGSPVAGVPVAFTTERRVTKASRVQGPGNAFVTQYIEDWEEADRQ
ncbi:MAG: MG2 domain-containing protein [Thermodesulfobacteriota bacterium]